MSSSRLSVSISIFLTAAAAAQNAPAPPPQGVTLLPTVVVTASPPGQSAFDLAQPVSSLSGTALKLKLGPTLGETLSGEPGIAASSYTAGASRPIIRGLADNRVLVLQNGTDIFDVSSLSPDHAPSVQPLNAQSIDVVRGPATVLYGSSAIGGVVNVLDRRIPTLVPDTPVTGEVNARIVSSTLERSTSGNFDLRLRDHLVLHLDGTLLRTDNLRIPGHAFSPRRRENLGDARKERGNRYGGDPEHVVPNTSVRSQDFGVGLSYVWDKGYIGVAFSQLASEYGVPDAGDRIDDPADFPARVKLDLRKRRYELRGSVQEPLPGFQAVNLNLGYTEYRHHELEDNLVGSTFRSHGMDSRLELLHHPIGRMEGSLGLQAVYRTLGVYGDEAFLRPNQTIQGAAFLFEEVKLAPIRFQFGARVEYQRIHIGSDDPAFTSLTHGASRTREFLLLSAAAGAIYDFTPDVNVALTARYAERAPAPEELFARGPHDATFQYLIGSPGLPKEKVLGLDLSLRRRAGFVTGSLSAFYNRFFDFIDFESTGETFGGELPVYRYSDKRADFLGGEGQMAFHFLPATAPAGPASAGRVKEIITAENLAAAPPERDLYLELSADYVYAEERTEHRSPGRIPPLRFGATLGYQTAAFTARLELQRVDSQTRHAEFETGTAGYTFLNASLSWTLSRGPVTYEMYLRGTNLTDEQARDHTSFLKDALPLPGRSVTVGVRALF